MHTVEGMFKFIVVTAGAEPPASPSDILRHVWEGSASPDSYRLSIGNPLSGNSSETPDDLQ